MIIIPAIDLKEGKCVRLQQGLMDKATVYSDDPATTAKHWETQGAELLHVVDLDVEKMLILPVDHVPRAGENVMLRIRMHWMISWVTTSTMSLIH